MKPRFSSLLAFAFLAVLCSPGAVPQDSGAASSDEEAERVLRELQKGLRTLNRISENLERSPLEPDQLVDEVGKDPEALTRWIADWIEWLPYVGALRGPRGVLIERRGNALDQSLLLAGALESAGHEVRLARATLEEEPAAELYEALRQRASAPEEAEPAAEWEADFARYARAFGADPAALRKVAEEMDLEAQEYLEVVLPTAVRQATDLKELLVESGVSATAGPELAEVAVGALRDHWWVQLADGRGGWEDLDPLALRAGVELSHSTEATGAPAELPADARHRLALRVVAERLGPDGLETEVALDHEVDAMELAGAYFHLEFAPLNTSEVGAPGPGEVDSGAYSLRIAEQETEWLPILAQVDYAGRREESLEASILIDGTLVEDPELDIKNRRMQKVVGVLGADGGGTGSGVSEDSHLTAVWIEYEILAPGRPPETVRRYVFDLLGDAQRLGGGGTPSLELDRDMRRQRGLALTEACQILPLTCRFSNEFILRYDLATKLRNQRIMMELVQSAREDGSRFAELAQELSAPPLELLTLSRLRTSLGRHSGRVFLGGLNLLANHVRPVLAPTGQVGEQDSGADPSVLLFARAVDIVENEVDVLEAGSGEEGPTPPWDVRLEQGVLDTILEHVSLAGMEWGEEPEGNPSGNPAMWMRGHPIDQWRALVPGGQIDSRASDTHARAAAALATETVVVLPEAILEARPEGVGAPGCWWRVDAATGTTLGIGPRGWGQAETVLGVAFLAAFPQEFEEAVNNHMKAIQLIQPIRARGISTVCFFAMVGARLVVGLAAGYAGQIGGSEGSALESVLMAMLSQAGATSAVYGYLTASCKAMFF